MKIEQLVTTIAFDPKEQLKLIHNIRNHLYLVKDPETENMGLLANITNSPYQLLGILPPIYPEWLGNKAFLETHELRFPYIVGEMANGIATAKMVISAVNAGMMSFFGAAGLMPSKVEENINEIQAHLGTCNKSWGSNLIHSPNEPYLEGKIVDLYLKKNVTRVSASAYMTLSPHIVHYATKGLTVDEYGVIHRHNYILAKISREEVAKHFMMPAPKEMLAALVREGKISEHEAWLATNIPVAEDITVEADSGGHTDNRPLGPLLSVIQALANELTETYGYTTPFRIGAAGGLGTPLSVASAFSLGSAYIVTGSINQSAVEAGISPAAKELLAKAHVADVMMAPAADMFELGVKLQVLKRGSLFGARATKLYEIYSSYASLEEIPEDEKQKLEDQIFKMSIDTIWQHTKNFFNTRDPAQTERASKDPKHRMALVFRWYLGLSSRWAIMGDTSRTLDYQIWCGPAMGAFNNWVKDSFLQHPNERTVEQIGYNLLEGAAILTRAHQLRSFGFVLPSESFNFTPRYLK
ncbi:MAG: PfaD family polyunsaturated fatty acid/polyketide biosynthesis protein [Chlamydiales bacterium]|nr:PfaD family polyunsaturated fatty acid/polyketide biosynthesis protein [Chlamydiales bacterium]